MVSLIPIVSAIVTGYLLVVVVSFLWRYRRLCHVLKSFSRSHPAHPLWRHFFHDKKNPKLKKNDVLVTERRPKMLVSWIGFIPLIYAIHPDTAKIILTSSDPKPSGRGQVYSVFRTFVGDGLVLSNGKKWERNRKLLIPAFNIDVLRPYISIYNETTDILLDKLARIMSEDPKSMEITKVLNLAVLDIILRCLMSHNGHVQKQENHPYVTAIREMGKLITTRYRNPLFLLSWTLFTLSANGKAYAKHVKFIHEFAEGLIAKRRQKLAESQTVLRNGKLDFLDILLTAKDENGDGMSDEDIRDEVDTFMSGGYDTTLASLLWTIYNLGKYPEEQQKVYQEVCEVVGYRKYVEWEDLSKLSRLTMFIKETLRLYPPGHATCRILTKDVEFDGVTIPAGTSVNVNILHMHRNEEVFPEPKVFRPERFLPEKAAERDPCAYIPFSAGPRNCIEQNFAFNALKVILSRLLKRFKIILDEDHRVVPALELIIRPQFGVKVRLEER